MFLNNFIKTMEKNKFNGYNINIASLGDLYDEKNENGIYDDNIDKYGNHIAYINPKQNSSKNKFKNIPKNKCNIEKYNVPIELIKNNTKTPTNKYSHKVYGKIMPKKSSYSIKPIKENIEAKNELEYRKIILYSHKVNINNDSFITNEKMNKKMKDSENPMIINRYYTNKQNQKVKNKNFFKSQQKILFESPIKIENGEKIIKNEYKVLLKDSEFLYKNTKLFIENLENKLPQNLNFENLLDKLQLIYSNLDNLKIKKIYDNRNHSYSANKRNRDIVHYEFDFEFKKKIEEKLEYLHISLRGLYNKLNLISKTNTTEKDYENEHQIIKYNKEISELKKRIEDLIELYKLFSSKIKNDYKKNNSNEKSKIDSYGNSCFPNLINSIGISSSIPTINDKLILTEKNNINLRENNKESIGISFNDTNKTIKEENIQFKTFSDKKEELNMQKENNYGNLNITNFIKDGLYSSYDVELPLSHYYKIVKREEPKNDDWFIRSHHIETITNNNKSKGDDILNSKYISYYKSIDNNNEINKISIIDEILTNIDLQLSKLKKSFDIKLNYNNNIKSQIEDLEYFKENLKKEYKEGDYFKAINNKDSTFLSIIDFDDIKNKNFSEMFNTKNENIQQVNTLINSYDEILLNLRYREKEILLQKRKEEYERIRPPLNKWWELKTKNFTEEENRNKLIMNANQRYYDKIKKLQEDDLY